jgi:hypothetical protein
MGILDRLFGGRFTMPPPEETNLSASAIMKELRPGPPDSTRKKALEAFTQALLAVVPEKEGARLVRRVMRRYAMGTTHAVLSPMDCWRVPSRKNLNTSC